MSAPARPIIAIVGRPNVGKSTLFNRLVGRRHSLVNDAPGVTRDRLYGQCVFERWRATVVDTGGFDPSQVSDLTEAVARQVMTAVDEADLIFFVIDARAGVTPLEWELARILRKSQKPVFLVANKVDSPKQVEQLSDCYELGIGEVFPISAEHGRGVDALLEAARAKLPTVEQTKPVSPAIAISLIGRPNVGKSSLANAILGSDRLLVHPQPGTTRDAVDTPFRYRERQYLLIDTAGIRRKGKVAHVLEKLSVVMALKSLERCHVALIVLDATEGIAAQDAHIAGYAEDAGRALIFVVNKWDLIQAQANQAVAMTRVIRERMPFLDYAPIVFTSAVTRDGLNQLFDQIDRVGAIALRRLPQAEVAPILKRALQRRPASLAGVPLTLSGAAQIGTLPATIVVRVNQPAGIHFSYKRYLINTLREAVDFTGTPIRLVFKRGPGRKARRPR
ncbi:MAG TPA: ribosome biogenesis GTPase Der [Methylomirabilota bacterium]|nr:ribosome biogenesis GTPase Der [Methylomirabilota bacterium]